jgi:hypothetical protein
MEGSRNGHACAQPRIVWQRDRRPTGRFHCAHYGGVAAGHIHTRQLVLRTASCLCLGMAGAALKALTNNGSSIFRFVASRTFSACGAGLVAWTVADHWSGRLNGKRLSKSSSSTFRDRTRAMCKVLPRSLRSMSHRTNTIPALAGLHAGRCSQSLSESHPCGDAGSMRPPSLIAM